MTQEERIEEIVKEFEKNIASCSLTETDICCGIEQLSKLHVEDWLRNTLATAIREAREEVVQKLEKGVLAEMSAGNQGAQGFASGYNTCRQATLDHIENIKKAITPNPPSH